MLRSLSRSDGRAARGGLKLFLVLVYVLVGAVATGGHADATEETVDIAVVVHPGVPADDVSFAELRRIMLGDQKFWRRGEPITLLVRAPVARERTVVLEKICKMSEAGFRKHWIGKVFRAETTSGPKVVLSSVMAVELVRVLPGAVALIIVGEVPEDVKVLRIDGRLPGDPDYALR